MKLPIELLKQIDDFVGELNNQPGLTAREEAIREAARLLVSLTHDEYYGRVAARNHYHCIAMACCKWVEEG